MIRGVRYRFRFECREQRVSINGADIRTYQLWLIRISVRIVSSVFRSLEKIKRYYGLNAGETPQSRYMPGVTMMENTRSFISDQKLNLPGNVLSGKRRRWDSGEWKGVYNQELCLVYPTPSFYENKVNFGNSSASIRVR